MRGEVGEISDSGLLTVRWIIELLELCEVGGRGGLMGGTMASSSDSAVRLGKSEA